MVPIRKGDGTTVMPDGIGQVRTGDGRVLFEDAIADSEANQKLIHRWLLDDVNGSIEDSIGDSDGTNNGIASISGDYVGGSAGEGDGVSHIVTDTWGDFGGSVLGTDFALAATIDNYTGDTSGGGLNTILGHRPNPGPRLVLEFFDGFLKFWITDDSGNSERVEIPESVLNDGNPHRIVANKTGNSASDLEIWVDGVDEETVPDAEQGFSSTNTSNFAENVPLFARRNTGDVGGEFVGVIDDISVFDDSLTPTEIGSYDVPSGGSGN